ncbi:MAG: acyl-ACP--UDP-N-acetylglucosamine O-acyltransferase [Rhodospirillales bacterium]|nr:acyl-ACP--UDP-N-acetylglucosamine O-acyltransferase [Rhodospirillales bacterium]
MPDIHATAVVDPAADIADDVTIGPYCTIGAGVRLGAFVRLVSHVVIDGETSLGEGCQVFPFASLGLRPQDLKYQGEPSRLEIGANNTIREYVTMNPGTKGGGLLTRVGDNGLFMVGAHVAHDCMLGDHIIMANNATLAGHVVVEDFAIIGGLSAVHQFVRIGRHAMVGGMSGVEQDVIPFGSVSGDRAHLMGLNLVGLKRNGFGRDDIHTMRNAYRLLFADEGTLGERMDDVDEVFGACPPVEAILAFMRIESTRGLCQPKDGHAA